MKKKILNLIVLSWYGRKIFHMLMSHDEFDKLLVKYLNEKTRKNIKEILDTIKVKVKSKCSFLNVKNLFF